MYFIDLKITHFWFVFRLKFLVTFWVGLSYVLIEMVGAFSVIFKWFFENSEEISRVRIVHVAKGYTFEDSQWRGKNFLRIFPELLKIF